MSAASAAAAAPVPPPDGSVLPLITRTMFDRPNKDAFYIVTHFLLHKLDPARFGEAYR